MKFQIKKKTQLAINNLLNNLFPDSIPFKSVCIAFNLVSIAFLDRSKPGMIVRARAHIGGSTHEKIGQVLVAQQRNRLPGLVSVHEVRIITGFP